MRVTVDLDRKSISELMTVLVKGSVLCRKIPSNIRRTRKGYHLIWRGLPIDEQKMYLLRFRLHDDRNRIRLDILSPKRIKQVLFSEKRTVYFDEDGGIKKEIVRR